MQITRSSIDTQKGPADWFTGDVYIDAVAAPEATRPGDRVFFEPGENHWHGAAPTRLMTHIAMHLADESGSPVTWGRHVSDDEYAQAPALEDADR